MTPSIDAHLHLWRLERGDYHWITKDLVTLRRDFEPEDALEVLRAAGVDAAVLVQAAASEAETRFLLRHAADQDWIRGVVGWVDMAAADAPERIAAMAEDPLLKGIRPMIQDIADDGWMLRRDLDPAYRAIVRADLAFDALVLPRHLPNLEVLVERHPDLRVVIDHGAKPDIASEALTPWSEAMERLAGAPMVVKLSGLLTEAGPGWSASRVRPFIDRLLELFGPHRLLWGSDWPVLTLAADYGAWRALSLDALGALSNDERGMVLGGNAARLYRL